MSKYFNYDQWKTAAPDETEDEETIEMGPDPDEDFHLAAADRALHKAIYATHQLIKDLEAAPEGEENALADLYDPRDRF